MSTGQLVQLLHPFLLVPLLVWIAYRYIPLVKDAGRPKAYILVFLCAGTVLVQVSRDGRATYPLSTWTMYSEAHPEPVFWRVMMSGDGWEEDVPWHHVAPVRSLRAFHRHFEVRAGELVHRRQAEQHDEAAASEAELATLLLEVAEALGNRREGGAIRELRVDRCAFDVRQFASAADIRCEVVLQVPVRAAGAR